MNSASNKKIENINEETILAIDRGVRKRGIAYKKAGIQITYPLGILENKNGIYKNIIELIRHYKISLILLGFTFSNRKVIKDVHIKIDQIVQGKIPIKLINESYTSIMAAEKVAKHYTSTPIDAMAAVELIERALGSS